MTHRLKHAPPKKSHTAVKRQTVSPRRHVRVRFEIQELYYLLYALGTNSWGWDVSALSIPTRIRQD
eukprot:282215-Amphidinium_carterae.1